MSDPIAAPPSGRDSLIETLPDSPTKGIADTPETHKIPNDASAVDVKALTDRTLRFLATASNETLGACLVGLGAGTYLILGRVGLVLIGVVGGVVLHATWEGQSHGDSNTDEQGKSAEARRRELGLDIAHRVLDWRGTRAAENGARRDIGSDLSLKLYSGKTLDYFEFKPQTAAALTELTDAVIRDYVKYVPGALPRCSSNPIQVVVLARTPCRRRFPRLVPPDLHCIRAFRIRASVPKATC